MIVGAGPAGLNAAIAAAEQGLAVKVIDEFPKAGGRLLGQLHQEPSGEWWNGLEESDKLYTKAVQLGVEIECEVSVYDMEKSPFGWKVYTSHGEEGANKLLLATGASEVPTPIPGWTLPGVMSIGAAQVMGNVHRVKPGNTCIIIGANVLSIEIANELRLCGIKVKEIIIPAANLSAGDAGNPVEVMKALMRLTHMAPSLFLRQAGKVSKLIKPSLAVKFYPKDGLKLFDIPIKIRTAATEIIGETRANGVRTVNVKADGKIIQGTESVSTADFVCIAGGLAPLPELAAISGCAFKYVKELGGHVPVHSEQMRTSIPSLFVAGNITGVESAKVAAAQGKVAGLTIATEVSGEEKKMEKIVDKAIADVRKIRESALIQFQPGIAEAREHIYHQFELDKMLKEEEVSVS